LIVCYWVLDYRIYIKSEIWSHTTGGQLIQMLLIRIALWREWKWRAHNRSYCLIEVVTNVGLTVFLLSLENHFKILKISAFKYWWILATYLVCRRPVSCVPNVFSVSGLYITDCPFSFLGRTKTRCIHTSLIYIHKNNHRSTWTFFNYRNIEIQILLLWTIERLTKSLNQRPFVRISDHS
jgi:hypothetical protein